MSVPFAPTLAGVQLMGLAWWLLLPAAAGGAWAICKLYRRETEPYPEARRWLFGLRAAAIALLALLLSQPVLHRVFARYQPPLVLVLRDNSPSMKVQDRQEPVERKLREAVVLGLIDAKLRDTRAEEAAQGLERAHADLEAATVSARQALQVLQQSAPDAGAARDRLAETRQGLAAAAKKLDAALDAWQGAPGAEAGELGAARKSAQDLKKLDGELGESDLENAQARQLLATRAHGVHELALALEKHAAAARMRQDLADRALAAQDRPEIQAALKKLAGMDRAALVDAVLDGKVAQAAGDRVQTVSYRLDSKLRPIEGAREEDAELEDAGTKGETDLATPLLRLAERHAQDPIAAVVLCSDGRHTSGPAPEEAARALAARGIVLHTLGAGGLEAPFDLCVARLEGSPSVFLDETIRLTAHLKVAGLQSSPGGPEIKNAKLVLRRGDEVLDERAAAFGRDGWFQQEFELKAEQAGTHVYGVTLEPLPGEALAENNHAEAVVDVANDRLKVLLADLMPRWESRYVASLLRRERKMTLDERWLLSGDGLGPKPAALPDDEQALEACDVVILGDIPPDRLDEAAQKRLLKYVGDRGGFLVLLAGPDAMPRSYANGPLAELLPVTQQAPDRAAAPVPSTDAPDRVRLKLDPGADRSEILRVLRDPTLNERLWPALPELHWISRPAYAKPGATPLLRSDDARQDVVVATHHYGAGRVLYIGTDQTWRWRQKVADRVHAVFWAQALRWGTGHRLTGPNRLKAALDRRQVQPGEDVEILARPRDADGKLAGRVPVVAEFVHAGHAQKVPLQEVQDGSGLYRGMLRNLPPGVHTIKLSVGAPGFGDVTHELKVVARETTGQEGVELARDSARLATMAKVGGGQARDLLEAEALFSQLAGQGKETTVEDSYELWCSYPVILLLTALLVAEWLYRKRLGLP